MPRIRPHHIAPLFLFPVLPGFALAQGADSAGNAATGELEEIVVTVQRRSERLLDVPIAISSVSSQELANAAVVGLFDINTIMPGVRVDHYGAYSQPTIRGVGTQDVQGPGANANVAIYVDGFYMPSQAGNIFEFANIERVDVLKGPQGTLFGQNATGGAIVVTTPDPSFTPAGSVSVGAGRFDEVRANLYATAGLSETVAADVSVYYRDGDGYFDNVNTGEPTVRVENAAVRSKILFQPSETARYVLTLEYSDINDPTGLAENTIDPLAMFYHDVLGAPGEYTTEPYKTTLNGEPKANPVTYAGGLKAVFDLGELSLTSLTQYRDQDSDIRADLDGTTVKYWQVAFDENEETFTQEFDLTNSGEGRLDWVAGLFYYWDEGQLVNHAFQDYMNTGTNTSWLYSDVTVTTESAAVFLDGTYELTDSLWLTAGARFTTEQKELDSKGLLAPFTEYSGSERWNSFTPRIALRYGLSDNANLYATISKGFMSGNYSYTTVGPQEPVDPEDITQYEIGYKFAQGRLSFDASVYFSDYEDLQVFAFNDGCGCYLVDNAEKAEIYGAEAHLVAPLGENLTVNAGVAWTHARYEDYVGAGLAGGPLIPPNYGFATQPTDFSGAEMIRAPDWTGNIGFNYQQPTSVGALGLSGNYYYSSEVPLMADNERSQDAYGLLNLTAYWTSPGDAWTVSVYGNNVSDEEYLIFSWAGAFGNNQIFGPPATYGAQVEFRF